MARDCTDPFEFGLQRRDAFLVDGRGIHATGELIAELLQWAAGDHLRQRRSLQNVEQYFLVAFAHFGEARIARAVGRKRVLRDPLAAGILIEIDARIRRSVDRARVESRAGRDRIGRQR